MKKYASLGKKNLRKYAANPRQIAGVRTSVLDDGKGRGIRVADIYNGSGLEFTVLLDRGMDIGRASFKGVPLAYLTSVGYAHPSLFEGEGFGWLRNWGGGLLTGCGLRNVGAPQEQEPFPQEGPMGLHGRLSNIPAENCWTAQEWMDGAYVLAVSGTVRESSMFGDNLELQRTIKTEMGSSTLMVGDTVTNRGTRKCPLMLLYHINLGFPIVSDTSVLKARRHKVAPRTPEAEADIREWNKCQKPTRGYAEQCFYHDIPAGKNGMATMTIENADLGLGVDVSYQKDELPFFTQWKMMGQGEYVMGLEPANCHPDGLAQEKKNGTLREIKPGESVEFVVTIAIKEL